MNLKHLFFGLFLSSQSAASLDLSYIRPSTDRLNPIEATERQAWAMRCFPVLREQIYSKGQRLNRYPTLAFVGDDGELSNPNSWFAPTSRDVDCEVPDGYKIVGYYMF